MIQVYEINIAFYLDFSIEYVGNQSSAYPTTQAFALPFKEDKQRQLAHAIVIYRPPQSEQI